MQQFSLYYALSAAIDKTVCTLTGKSYERNLRMVILVSNLEAQENLNKTLWTYSQKEFIPHGSNLDPLPSSQPVYITDKLERPNEADMLIIVNSDDIIKILNNNAYISLFKRIMIISDLLNQATLTEITEWVNRTKIKDMIIDFYKQNPNNAWTEFDPNLPLQS